MHVPHLSTRALTHAHMHEHMHHVYTHALIHVSEYTPVHRARATASVVPQPPLAQLCERLHACMHACMRACMCASHVVSGCMCMRAHISYVYAGQKESVCVCACMRACTRTVAHERSLSQLCQPQHLPLSCMRVCVRVCACVRACLRARVCIVVCMQHVHGCSPLRAKAKEGPSTHVSQVSIERRA